MGFYFILFHDCLSKAGRLLINLILILYCFPIIAQEKQGANWIFGGTHLDFNTPIPKTQPVDYDYKASAGVATMSDKNGNLLFFSSQGNVASRQKVNNKYQLMLNGSVFGVASPGTHAELIMQNPLEKHRYYIFLRTFTDEIYVAEIDM